MKNKYIAAVLAFFIGGLGVHKFYLGKTSSGILYLVFCWTFIPAILALIDMILLLCMSEDEFNKKYNHKEIREIRQQFPRPNALK
jgi:TM2 domain-containing membrane protein YozV